MKDGPVIFLDDEGEAATVARLRMQCGAVVIVPDATNADRSWLYHTSCQRMTDVVSQIFGGSMEAPISLPQEPADMTLGELYRQSVTMPYVGCKARVESFDF